MTKYFHTPFSENTLFPTKKISESHQFQTTIPKISKYIIIMQVICQEE